MHHLTNTKTLINICIIVLATKIFKYELLFQTSTNYFFRIVHMAATSSRQFKKICILFRFHYRKHKKFIQAAINLGLVLVERKIHLVYKGDDRRLSKLFLKAIYIGESQMLGIIPKALKHLGCLPDQLTRVELVISSM